MRSLYRRPLPDDLVAFASEEGRRLFGEALTAGHMEGFFALSEQFHTQAEPAFCGLGSLVVVLNALAIDPGRLWKGPWRWFSEELLDCCAPLDRVREKGLSLDELACLAECNGAETRVERPASLDRFREDVLLATRSAREPIMVVGYTRKLLGQTGDGHFSPVGGYHPGRDAVLLLDVARFKYPPHWVPLARLFEAMKPLDPESGKPRGWIVFGKRPSATPLLFCVSTNRTPHEIGDALVHELPRALAEIAPRQAKDALRAFARALSTAASFELRDCAAPEHETAAGRVRAAIRETAAFAAMRDVLPPTIAEAAAAVAIAAPRDVWSGVGEGLRRELDTILAADAERPELASELARIRGQLVALARLSTTTAPADRPASSPGSPP